MAIRSSIQGALPIAGAYFTKQFGGKIVISDTAPTASCAADGTVTIPNTSNKAVWGYAKHEWFHSLWSDFDVLKQIGSNPLRFGLFMAFEDSRIERLGMSKWPGTRHSLKETVEYVREIGGFVAVTDKDHPAMVLQAKTLYWLRANLLNQPLADLEAGADKAMRVLYPMGVNTRLALLLRKAVGLSTSQDSLNLADKILVMLQEEEEKERDKQQQAQAQGDSGDGDADTGNSDQDSNRQADDQGSLPSSDSDSESDSQDGQGTGSAEKSAQQGASDSASGGQAGAIAQALSAGDGDVMQDPHEMLRERLFEEADANPSDPLRDVPTPIMARGNPSDGRALMAQAARTSNQVARALANLVESHRERKESLSWRGSKLDTKHLVRVRTGVREVFVRTEDREEAFTSVHLLCDLSGSMGGYNEVVAREATMALALALEAIEGVETAVTYFLDDESTPIRTVVGFGDSARRNSARFALDAEGGTPMAEAMWYAAWTFADRLENRKILMVVTDGEPNDHEAVDYISNVLKNDDVEIIGIGIGTKSVRRLFPNSIVINSVDELKTALFGVMADRLTA